MARVGSLVVCYFSDKPSSEMLSIPSSVWKVCRFHYTPSHFTAALPVFLRGSLRVWGNFCGLVSPDLKHEVREGMAVVLQGTITCFFKHTRTDMSAGSLLSGTGKQKRGSHG